MEHESESLLRALSDMGVVIAYAPHLSRAAFWIPAAGAVLMDAQRSRDQLSLALAVLLPRIRRDLGLPL